MTDKKQPHLWFHARIQMQRRHIAWELLQETLAQPDNILLGDYGRQIFQKLVLHQGSRKLLRLVVETNVRGEQEIVTMYLTSKIGKYLGEH